MSDLFWLTDTQMARLEPFFPKSHGKPRVDDRHVLSGIIFINRNDLRCRDAPAAYGPHKTLYNRWMRWSDTGVSARMMAGLTAAHDKQKGSTPATPFSPVLVGVLFLPVSALVLNRAGFAGGFNS